MSHLGPANTPVSKIWSGLGCRVIEVQTSDTRRTARDEVLAFTESHLFEILGYARGEGGT